MPPQLKPDHVSPTDEEDAAIEAAIASDPDHQGWENAGPPRPAIEVVPDLVEASKRLRGMRGKQRLPTKVHVNLRLDADVVEHFQATGKGWQVRINGALRKAMLEGQPTD